MTITIPAACLDALGGLADTDNAVVCSIPDASYDVLGKHPLITAELYPGYADRDWWQTLLVTQSSGAMLQVLARHVGLELAEGEVPRWMNVDPGAGEWWIGAEAVVCHSFSLDDGANHPCPALTPEMSRMRALAEVFVWLARVERAKAQYVGDRVMTVEDLEAMFGLPAWEVSAG